jgi:hypothetical protein
VLTRAAKLRPKFSGTWRLLGDSCYIVRWVKSSLSVFLRSIALGLNLLGHFYNYLVECGDQFFFVAGGLEDNTVCGNVGGDFVDSLLAHRTCLEASGFRSYIFSKKVCYFIPLVFHQSNLSWPPVVFHQLTLSGPLIYHVKYFIIRF